MFDAQPASSGAAPIDAVADGASIAKATTDAAAAAAQEKPLFVLPTTSAAFFKLRNFMLYDDPLRSKLYLIGSDNVKKRYRIMKITKERYSQASQDESAAQSHSHQLDIHEDPCTYSAQQMKELLKMLSEAAKLPVEEKPSSKKSKNKAVAQKQQPKSCAVAADASAAAITTDASSDSIPSIDAQNATAQQQDATAAATAATATARRSQGQQQHTQGGLVLRARAYGVLGFIKFTKGYYMILITNRNKVGQIGCHSIYEISGTAFVPLFVEQNAASASSSATAADTRSNHSAFSGLFKSDESKYREIFDSLELNKDFFFSYSYDLSEPLQHNMIQTQSQSQSQSVAANDGTHFNEFVWNSFLLQPLFESNHNSSKAQLAQWILPAVHGFYGQRSIQILGKTLEIVLMARRSRFYAGTRYLKRGLNDSGHVANHVETEQIVIDASSLLCSQRSGRLSSFVLIRGSIPLHWSQTISGKVQMAKPDIVFGKFDPLYAASRKHFDQLFSRHGTPLICLDLVKQHEKKPRESIISSAYRTAVEFLRSTAYRHENDDDYQEITSNPDTIRRDLDYVQCDFRAHTKSSPDRLLNEMSAIAEDVLAQTGLFCSQSTADPKGYQLQSGCVRVNCIDCLDRTNVGQFFIGKHALGQQLYAIGIIDTPFLLFHNSIVRILMDLYDAMGDRLALQYGGSETVSAGINHRGRLGWDTITSLKRFYSNNFQDEKRQGAMNLMLGTYQPQKQSSGSGSGVRSKSNMPKLWDLENDEYLHEFREDKSSHDTISDLNEFSVLMMEEEEETMFEDAEIIESSSAAAAAAKLSEDERSERFYEETFLPYEVSSLEEMLPNPSVIIPAPADLHLSAAPAAAAAAAAARPGLVEFALPSEDDQGTKTPVKKNRSSSTQKKRKGSGAEVKVIPDGAGQVDEGSDDEEVDEEEDAAAADEQLEEYPLSPEPEDMDQQAIDPEAFEPDVTIKNSAMAAAQAAALRVWKTQSEVLSSLEDTMHEQSSLTHHYTRNNQKIVHVNMPLDEAIVIKTCDADLALFEAYCSEFRVPGLDVRPCWRSSSGTGFKATDYGICSEQSTAKRDYYKKFLDSCFDEQSTTFRVAAADLRLYRAYCEEDKQLSTDRAKSRYDEASKILEYSKMMQSVQPGTLLRSVLQQQRLEKNWRLPQYAFDGPQFEEMKRFFPSHLDNETIYRRVRRLAARLKRELAVSDRIRYEMPSRKALLSKLTLFELLNARLHRKCFVGQKAAEWIVQNKVLSAAQGFENESEHALAEAFLDAMLRTHVFHEVRFEREFHADHHLFRFNDDDTIRVLNCLLDDEQHAASASASFHRTPDSIGIVPSLFSDATISMQDNEGPLELSQRLVQKAVKLFAQFWKIPQVKYQLSGSYYGEAFGGQHVISSAIVSNNRVPLSLVKQMQPKQVVRMVNTQAFQDFVSETAKLRNMDLSVLGRQEKTCFWINCFNALFLHGLMLQGGFGSTQKAKNELTAMSFMRRTAYQISGHLFTLQDIRDGMLRGNKLSPNSFSRPFERADDPRIQLLLRFNFDKEPASADGGFGGTSDLNRLHQTFDPRVLFLISSFQSINLFHVKPDELEQILTAESADFCLRCSQLILDPLGQPSALQVSVFFRRFCMDFGSGDKLLRNLVNMLPKDCLMRSHLLQLIKQQGVTLPIVYGVGQQQVTTVAVAVPAAPASTPAAVGASSAAVTSIVSNQ